MTISTPLDLATDGRDAMIADRDERRAAAPRARLPGPDGHPRPLRLHQRHQVDHPDHADHLRRRSRPTGPSGTGPPTPRSRSPARIDTPRPLADHQGRRDRHRRRRLGPAAGRCREGAGPDRRRRLAGRRARPRAPATTTGASGSTAGTPAGQPHASPPASSTAPATCRPPRGRARSPTAPAASRTPHRQRGLSHPDHTVRRSANPVPREPATELPCQLRPTGRHHLMKLQTAPPQAGSPPPPLALSVSLAACGDDEADHDRHRETTSETTPAETPSQAAEADASEGTFGDACCRRPDRRARLLRRHGPGPRSPPPPATTRCSPPWSPPSAPSGLGDTLNGAQALTVFAPANDAFDKIPQADLETPAAQPTRRP